MNKIKLLEKKGTPLRFEITFSNGESIAIEPLKENADGLIISNKISNKYLNLDKIPNKNFHLINSKGEILKSISVEKDTEITRVVSFVLYPDGSFWAGEILNDRPKNIGAIVWTNDIAENLFISDDLKNVFNGNEWEKTPTIIAINPVPNADCPRIEHTCNDCMLFGKHLNK